MKSMRRVFITTVALIAAAPAALAFDIDSYCKKVAESVGGSYQIYEQCLKDENAAKTRTTTGGRDGLKKFFQEPNKGLTIYVNWDSFEDLGETRTFWKLTKYAKPQDSEVYDLERRKTVRIQWSEKFEWMAVYCNKTEAEKIYRQMKSFAVTLGSTYFDKKGQALHRDTYPDAHTNAQAYNPANGDNFPNLYQTIIPGTYSELNYRIACE